jgi:hypothetical protein
MKEERNSNKLKIILQDSQGYYTYKTGTGCYEKGAIRKPENSFPHFFKVMVCLTEWTRIKIKLRWVPVAHSYNHSYLGS